MPKRSHASLAVLAAVLLAAPAIAQAPPSELAETHTIAVPELPLDEALTELGRQIGLQIIVFADDSGERMSPPLEGSLSGNDALSAMLDGTGLIVKQVDDSTLAVGTKARLDPADEAGSGSYGTTEEPGEPIVSPGTESKDSSATPLNPIPIESTEPANAPDSDLVADRILVTGTRIRGAAPVGAPLTTLSAEDILRSGYGTASEILSDLPQNFGGDSKEEIVVTDAGGSNLSGSAGVNLRGLGASSTLTLVNGRRLAQNGGTNGSFADISSIPVSAIERVEILTDGASAIYGSDAISGVVNFILKEDYEGAETSLRYSDTSRGGANDVRFSQSFGKAWNSGNVFFNYEYYSRNNLRNEDRPFTSSVDLTPLGGDDFRVQSAANPGTIIVPVLAAIPTGQDGTSLTPADLILGQANLFDTAKNRDLLKEQERNSVYIHLNQDLSANTKIFAELRASERSYEGLLGGDNLAGQLVTAAHPYYVSPAPDLGYIFINYDLTEDLGVEVAGGDVTSVAGAVGLDRKFANGWRLDTFASYVRDESTFLQSSADRGRVNEALGLTDLDPNFDPLIDGYFNPFGDGSNTPQNVLDYIGAGYSGNDTTSEGWSINAMVDGDLFSMPGGFAKFATGAEIRGETFEKTSYGANLGEYSEITDFSIDREVTAVFAEIFLPFVGPDNARDGVQRLEASAAIRYEDYSDFGNTTNPKIGLSWQPVTDLTFRGTWGTSFKAPRLNDLVPDPYLSSGVFSLPDPLSTSGSSTLLLIQGANPDLEAETSTAWTAGFDYRPSWIENSSLEITYFDISFDDRIGVIPGSFTNLLTDPAFTAIIDRSPDANAIAPYFDSPFPFFSDSVGITGPGDIQVVADIRPQNLASTHVNGIDAKAEYSTGLSGGDLRLDLNANYLFEFVQSAAPGIPEEDLSGTPGRPANIRARLDASWSRDAWQFGGSLNYTGGYDDDTSTPTRDVDNYTTTDLVVSWTSDTESDWLSGIRAAFNVYNVFDEDPPFVNQPLGYDPANADPYGRIFAISLSKAW